MRDILFRGKDENGKWHYGGFHKWETRQPCVGDELADDEIKYCIVENSFADWNMPRKIQVVEVNPETVGQFTGMHDAHNTPIFEGDAVLYDGDLIIVQWNEDTAQFVVRYDSYSADWDNLCDNMGKVIGNIYDRPELLCQCNGEIYRERRSVLKGENKNE